MNPETSFDYGSFRDPSGGVFYHEGEVYRYVDDPTWTVMRQLQEKGFLAQLVADGLLVATELVPDSGPLHDELKRAVPSATQFLKHACIPFVSYAYEWPTAMMADAAALQLALQLRLLDAGFSLKDSSIYNIQFRNGRPVFIDIPSIEVPERRDVWVAYGQFCRLFLFPLLLRRYRHIDTRACYALHIDGVDIEETYRMLGPWQSLRPALFLDVFLQRHLHGYGVKHQAEIKARKPAATPGVARQNDASAQVLNLKRLLRKIRKIRRTTKHSGHWTDYTETHSYTEAAERHKVEFVKRVLAERAPRAVLDLGCNTGTYSMLAAEAGASVVAVDSDHDCVDRLYGVLQGTSKNILPLWMDLANPSPGIGFRNRERKSFLDRADFDCVFALALIHHLLIVSRVPMPEIRDLFCELSKRWLIVEFIPREDAMFQQLLALREDIYGHITKEYFEQVFSERYAIVESFDIPETKRTLYLMEKSRALSSPSLSLPSQ